MAARQGTNSPWTTKTPARLSSITAAISAGARRQLTATLTAPVERAAEQDLEVLEPVSIQEGDPSRRPRRRRPAVRARRAQARWWCCAQVTVVALETEHGPVAELDDIVPEHLGHARTHRLPLSPSGRWRPGPGDTVGPTGSSAELGAPLGRTYHRSMADNPLYFRQLLSGRDFAVGDPLARQMVNFVYLIGDRRAGEAVIVDPAYDIDGLLGVLGADDMRCVGVLATHFHPDHVGGDMMGYRIEGRHEPARDVAGARARPGSRSPVGGPRHRSLRGRARRARQR